MIEPRPNFGDNVKMFLRKLVLLFCLTLLLGSKTFAGGYALSVKGDQILLNGKEIKILGLRCSNALISDKATNDLIEQLDDFKSYGVNTVSVFFMGSRFGDVKGYRPDGSLNPVYTKRMGRIIEAADHRGMIVLVGCLYWSTSRAKEDLKHWKQSDANTAIANTVAWLKQNNYRNVFVDVDNEGMAHDEKGWSIESMINAAHSVDRSIMIAYNDSAPPPSNADLYIHHSPKVKGKPWLDSEATPKTRDGYWGRYSKESHMESKGVFYNYSRIGRYTAEMKADQIRRTKDEMQKFNGHILASTWLQCVPNHEIGGPFSKPGGDSNIPDVDMDIDVLHPDAGIRWWLRFIKEEYGPWAASPSDPLKRQPLR